MTQLEIERTERLIASNNRLAEALENSQGLAASLLRFANVLQKFETPPPGWLRIVEDFQRAVRQIPTSIRTRF